MEGDGVERITAFLKQPQTILRLISIVSFELAQSQLFIVYRYILYSLDERVVEHFATFPLSAI